MESRWPATMSPFTVGCKGMSSDAKATSKIHSVSSVERRVPVVWNALALMLDSLSGTLICMFEAH